MDTSRVRQAVIESQFGLMTAEENDGLKSIIENELASFAREYPRSSNKLEQEDIEYFLLNMSKGKEKMKNKMKVKESDLRYCITRNDDAEFGVSVKVMIPDLLVTWTYRENTLSEPSQKRNQWFCSVRVKRGKQVTEQKAFLEEPNLNRVVPQIHCVNSQTTQESDVDWDNV